MYIAFDPEMREGPEGEGARARNSDIVEDLGMVEYVFSDKTGTLTSNEMQLRMLCIMSVPFGSIDYRCTMLWLLLLLDINVQVNACQVLAAGDGHAEQGQFTFGHTVSSKSHVS